MFILYDGSHSIDFFGDIQKRGTMAAINTWRDLHLIPTSKPYVNPPEVNFNIVSVPGSNRVLDLTNYLYSNDLIFSTRKGEWEFIIDLEHWKSAENAYAYLMANFHGRRTYCELQDDPETVYKGRVSISSFKSGDNYPTVTLSYLFSPTFHHYKSTEEDGSQVYGEAVIEVDDIEKENEYVDIDPEDITYTDDD